MGTPGRRPPVWVHLLAATAVLLLAGLTSRPGSAYFSDEGAAVIQAELLSRTGTWVYENPVPELDPDNTALPFPTGDQGEKGRAPYLRHPLYPRLLQATRAVAGTPGMVGLSIAGTLAAAWCAARLARRVRPELAPLALWLVVVSPLFFDSLLVFAHTLAAAATAGATLALAWALDAERWRRWAGVALVGAGTAAAAGVRTEGTFVGLALGAAAAFVFWRRRSAVAVAAAVAAVAGAVAVDIAERAFHAATLGPGAGAVIFDGTGFWSDRGDAFYATWLLPGDRPLVTSAALLIVGMAAVGLAALLVRTGRTAPAVALAWVAAGCYLVRLIVGPVGTISGLLVAFPLGWAALLLIGGDDVRAETSRLAALTAAVVAVAVVLTQYRLGGGVEWGGRYFAVVLPLAAVPGAAALHRSATRMASGLRRRAMAAVAVATAATLLMALTTIRESRDHTAVAGDVVAAAAARTGEVRPVVVTTEPLLPQLLWPDFGDYRWLVAQDRALAAVVGRAARLGVPRLVLATADPGRARQWLGSAYRVEHPQGRGPVYALVLERR